MLLSNMIRCHTFQRDEFELLSSWDYVVRMAASDQNHGGSWVETARRLRNVSRDDIETPKRFEHYSMLAGESGKLSPVHIDQQKVYETLLRRRAYLHSLQKRGNAPRADK